MGRGKGLGRRSGGDEGKDGAASRRREGGGRRSPLYLQQEGGQDRNQKTGDEEMGYLERVRARRRRI